MKILNIAEKPSVAREISKLLDRNCTIKQGKHKYCPNIYFSYDNEMIFTSVLGHLYTYDFPNSRNWNEIDPYELFSTPITKTIPREMQPVANNIISLARACDVVAIWTDCDREGENIAMQIKSLVPGKRVKRARFSGISFPEINHAMQNLGEINEQESDAVEARMELDLRIGSAFTRIQTLAYQSIRPRSTHKNQVLSFGPCQIPTLNFVVQRHNRIVDFKPEKFYSLKNKVTKSNKETTFNWKRGNIFDRNSVLIFKKILKDGILKITAKRVNNKTKYKPLPLRTVEFQKRCGGYYKIPGARLMNIAEKLYNRGYISYPRTETDSFQDNFNLTRIKRILEKDNVVGDYAASLLPSKPRSGKNNDQAHSPIYPLKPGTELSGEERNVYEFVARHFLASISQDATGMETEYTAEVAAEGYGVREEFIAKGLKVLEQNYLKIYIYDKWNDSGVGDFEIGEVVPNEIEVTEGKTTAPEYLTEAELISLMDQNGIGTDATIHEHIQKIQTREYAKMERNKIVPTELGVNLIEAYTILNLDINEPTIRKNLENGLREICSGNIRKVELVEREIRVYKEVYQVLQGGIEVFKDVIRKEEKEVGVARRKKSEEVKCDCGYDAVEKVAQTETNNGRRFYCCNKNYKRCKFFKWVDQM